MDVLAGFKEKAKAKRRRIVLPEGAELRTLKGAAQAVAEGLAEPILLGNEAEIRALAQQEQISLDGLTIIDIASSADLSAFAEQFYELRKHKGMTLEKAEQTVRNPLYYGNLMLLQGKADGLLAGADNTTGDVLRCFADSKTKPGYQNRFRCLCYDFVGSDLWRSGCVYFWRLRCESQSG